MGPTYGRWNGQAMKLPTYLYPVQRLRLQGAQFPPLYAFKAALTKEHGTFTFNLRNASATDAQTIRNTSQSR
jgi:hypothetical protein